MAPSTLSGGSVARDLTERQLCAAVDFLLSDDGPSARFASEIAGRRPEYDAIVDMLLEYSTPNIGQQRARELAGVVAAGCLGEQHLWLDLQLPNRRALRRLFETFFEPFAADNVMDMRRKKFIYKRLCRWGGFNTCQSPSCGACKDYQECFGAGA